VTDEMLHACGDETPTVRVQNCFSCSNCYLLHIKKFPEKYLDLRGKWRKTQVAYYCCDKEMKEVNGLDM